MTIVEPCDTPKLVSRFSDTLSSVGKYCCLLIGRLLSSEGNVEKYGCFIITSRCTILYG